MLEPKTPPPRNGPNTGSLAPGVRRRVKKNLEKTVRVKLPIHKNTGVVNLSKIL